MALCSEANARAATTLVDESYEDEDSFELIPPVISVSKNVPRNTSSPPPKRRRRAQSPKSSSAKTRTMMTMRERKRHSSPKKQQQQQQQQHMPWIVAMIVLILLVVGGAFLFRLTIGPQDIEELRLEFKRDIESIRSEVEQDLVAHFLTTTKVHTTTETEAMEPENDLKIEPIPTIKSGSGIDPVRFTMESETTVDTHSFGHALKEGMGDGYRMLESRLQSIEIRSLLHWIEDSMFCGLQSTSMYMATISSWDSAQNPVLRHAKPIYVAVVDSWNFAQSTVLHQLQVIYDATFSLDWIQNPTIRNGIEFANQHRLEFCVWYTAWMLLLYNCFRCYFGGNQKVSSKASDSISPSANAEGSDDECSENNKDPEERIEDVVMEHMFHDSMATTGNRDWPTVASPVYSRGNRINNNRNRASTAGSGSNSRASNTNSNSSNITNSNEEQGFRARTNAREFAARDKLRNAEGHLAARVPNAAASSAPRGNAPKLSKEERRHRARIHAQVFAAKDKQRLAGNGGKIAAAAAAASASLKAPRNADSSPWASKRSRLKQARANAKLYAEHDKQRLQKAAADSPWKRRNRNI